MVEFSCTPCSDLAYAIQQLSQFSSMVHFRMRYLQGTQTTGFRYGKHSSEFTLPVQGYCAADHAADDHRKLISGYLGTLAGSPIASEETNDGG